MHLRVNEAYQFLIGWWLPDASDRLIRDKNNNWQILMKHGLCLYVSINLVKFEDDIFCIYYTGVEHLICDIIVSILWPWPYWSLYPLWWYYFHQLCVYSKTVLSSHSKWRPQIGFQDRLSLIAGQKYCRILQESILQYFRPSLSYHLSLRPLFCLFLSGRSRQVSLFKM